VGSGVRVVVVGAGLAGLRAAVRLRSAGADVTLVEAGRRVGGRARTVRDGFHDHQYVESGAEWVDGDHPLMLELLDRYGIAVLGDGHDWTTLRRMLFRNGVLSTPDELRDQHPSLDEEMARYESIFEEIAAGIADPARPDLHPLAALHDARSMADVANDAGLGALAQLFATRNSQGEFAEEPHAVSSLFVAQQRAVGGHGVSDDLRSYRIDGGVSQVAHHLAVELGEAVSLGEQVKAVEWGEHGVRVTTGLRTVDADHVVLACSLVPLRRVQFTPELPAPLHAAVHGLGYGTVTKTAAQYPDRTTMRPGFVNCDLPSQRIYETTAEQLGKCGVLMAYTGGDGGRSLAERDEAQRIATVVADQQLVHGITDQPLAAFSRAWSNEARYGGSYAVYRPGQVTAYWKVLREPCGPLWLAGEHTATWTGYMEGAVESGDRVADGIIASEHSL
jgi:monoamine oxidase